MHSLTQPLVHALDQAVPAAVNMRRSYDRYYATGLYDSRYPAPNPHLLRLILDELGPAGGRILDFGCGNGRYALALARQPGVEVFAYDISAAAIRDLDRRRSEMAAAGNAPAPLEMLCGSLEELEQRLEDDPGFDLAVLLFGVLGHIEKRSRRIAVLRSLRRRLRPGGRLIVTVPNRARRFLAEQEFARELVSDGVLEPGDVHYQRDAAGDPIDLFYHLYTPAEFRAEVANAGFAVESLRPESVLSERMVLASPTGARVDGVLRRVTPVSFAYGMVAVARPSPIPAG